MIIFLIQSHQTRILSAGLWMAWNWYGLSCINPANVQLDCVECRQLGHILCLGLVATTRTGSSYLGHRGWATVRHARTDTWPITYEWLGASDYLFPYSAETIRMNQESPAPSEGWLEETVASGFDFMGYRKRDEPERVRSRRTKTMSECTDTSLSQNMVEIGPPPVEPNFPLPGKLTEKISNWFSTSKSEGRHEPKNGTSRRYSEGGKPGSSFTSKLRNSFNRKRSKTISAGSK